MTAGSASFSASQTKGRSISRKMTGITPVQHFLLSATTQHFLHLQHEDNMQGWTQLQSG